MNFVNAPFIAKERGIEIKETKSEGSGDYQNMLVLKVKYDGNENEIAGTLYGRKDPRIVRIDNFPVEVMPEGMLLYIQNNDMPGVIGNIGMILGENGINIARMHFGRELKGGRAISVVSVDAEIPDDIVNKIKAMPNINQVKIIRL
ncbi:MAG TPA: ACT domain-containing protein [Nitrospirae bacterium]|nr:ACT domain-containing protein [Nitrospirota bacterium]